MRRIVILGVLTSASCASFRPPAGHAAGGGDKGGGDDCATLAMIEDAEDGDDQVNVVAGRGGYLYTFVDEHGSEVAPRGEVMPSEGGAGGSARALRFAGKLGAGDEAYAGLGLSLTEPTGPYDATRWTGLSFRAKRGPGKAAQLRVKLPDGNTDPAGGTCKACYNDFGVSLELTEEWTRYEVAFADLKQEDGWGEPRPPALDAAKLFAVQWLVATPGAEFDVWIDDVSFVGCAPAAEGK